VFEQAELELVYNEKTLNPKVEQEIKDGFFEIKKKYDEEDVLQKDDR